MPDLSLTHGPVSLEHPQEPPATLEPPVLADKPAVADGRLARRVVGKSGAKRQFKDPVQRLGKADYLVLIALCLTCYEGAIRKWVIGSEAGAASYLVYFSKDIAFAALIFCRATRLPTVASNTYARWLLFGSVLTIVGAVMSSVVSGVNPIGAVLTLRSMLLLPLVAFLAAKRLSPRTLIIMIWILLVATAINCALGIAQHDLPPDNPLNRYVVSDAEVGASEAGVRATGTFAYITGLGVLSTIGVWAGVALLSTAAVSWQRTVGWLGIAAGFGCGLATISRATMVLGVAIVILWMLLARVRMGVFLRSMGGAGIAAMLALLLGAVPITQHLIEGMQARLEEVDDTFDDRAFGQIDELVEVITLVPFGNGLGSEQVGANYYTHGVLTFSNFEAQLPRLLLETGVLGVIGFVITCTGAVVALQVAKRRTPTGSGKRILLATQLMLAPMFYINVAFNHTACSFVWLIFAAALAAVVQGPEKRSGPLLKNP